MSLAYRIIKWQQRHSNYEQARSGGRWIVCPTRFDSLGLRTLLAKGDKGVRALGVYLLLAELAARMPTPGVLANDDGALSIDQISVITGCPGRSVGAALDLLQAPDIQWVDRVPTPDQPGQSNADLDGMNPDIVRRESGTIPDESEPSRVARGGARAAAAAANCCAGGCGGSEAILRRIGVPERYIADILGLHAIDPTQVVAEWADVSANPKVRRKGAYLAKRLIDGDATESLSSEALRAALKAGIVEAVNGVQASGKRIAYNSEGVYADGDLLASMEQIRKGEVELQ